MSRTYIVISRAGIKGLPPGVYQLVDQDKAKRTATLQRQQRHYVVTSDLLQQLLASGDADLAGQEPKL
jgi:hypothetical protein